MKNETSAFPTLESAGDVSCSSGGLTKREIFAMSAMQGIMSSEHVLSFCRAYGFAAYDVQDISKEIAASAVKQADALLQELEK